MSAYGSEVHDDVVQVQHVDPDSFGSGRLIGNNLVLTARHVVRPSNEIIDDGWQIRRIGDRPLNWPETPWKWLQGTVVYVSKAHDLALLRISEPNGLHPIYRTRVAIVKTDGDRPVDGAGFPHGSKTANRIDLSTPPGELKDEKRATLTFGINQAFQPEDPRSDWQGFSGSAIVHREVRDPRDLWIYGVAQQVPANFTKKIEVARLAAALSDTALTGLLAKAGVDRFDPADPCLLPSAGDFPDIDRLRTYADGRLKDAANNRMETRATLCSSFTDLEKLHRGGASSGATFAPTELLKEVTSGATLLVKAPGGCGKSFFLLHMMLAAIDEGMVPFFLDLRGVDLKLDGDPDEDSCIQLFKKASQKAVRWDVLREARDRSFGIFVGVDGINEARAPELIERTLGFLVKDFGTRLILVVTDRMSDRSPQFPAQLCTILPLAESAIAKRLSGVPLADLGDGLRYLLTIPFFLALYEKIEYNSRAEGGSSLPQTRSEMLFAYIALCNDSKIHSEDMLKAGKELVAKLAPIAFEGYRRGGVRMNNDWFMIELNKAEIQQDKLEKAGLLVNHPDSTIAFSHQLFHDFLSGYYLAAKGESEPGTSDESFWCSSNFDVATLRAKSYDSLEFSLELLADKPDKFVIEVYDWNYQAAINLILTLVANKSIPEVERIRPLRDAMIALNGEKRFDSFLHTRESAAKSAVSIGQVIQSPYNDPAPESLEALLWQVNTTYEYSGEYQNWKRAFLLAGKPAHRDWALLQASPLIAWTAANAFRRSLSKDDELVDYLCDLYDVLYERHPLADSAIGIRWRIVHILGAVDSSYIVEKLFDAVEREALKQQTQWIQYGAARSLVEIAARRNAVSDVDAILTKLTDMMGQTILVQTRAFGGLRNYAIPVKYPLGWRESYSRVLIRGAELTTGTPDAELWEARLADLKTACP